MKKITIIVVGILICLILIHFFDLPEMPEIIRGEMRVTPDSLECQQPNSVNLWKTLVEKMAFLNESALLIQQNQRIARNGTVQYTQLYFTAEKDGETYFYEVFASSAGGISFKYHNFDHSMQGQHPLEVFQEVDRINFVDLFLGEYNGTLRTFKHEGEKIYDETFGNIFILSDGSFYPLKKVVFPNGTHWYTIEIVLEMDQGTNMLGTSTTQNGANIIAFIEQDITMADSLVYA